MCEAFVTLEFLVVGLVIAALAWWQLHAPPERQAHGPIARLVTPTKQPVECKIRRITYKGGHTEELHSHCGGHLDKDLFRTVPPNATVIKDTSHWV